MRFTDIATFVLQHATFSNPTSIHIHIQLVDNTALHPEHN